MNKKQWCGCSDAEPKRVINNNCSECNTKAYIPSNFTDPQYNNCKQPGKTNLPPGICDSKEWECFDKTPYCAIEEGYKLWMFKLSEFIDLDILHWFDPKNFLEIPDNIDYLNCIDYKPLKWVISWANTVAHTHPDWTVQIDLVTTFPFSQLKSVSYPKFSWTKLDVIWNVESIDQIWVYMSWLLLMKDVDYTTEEPNGGLYYKICFPTNMKCKNIVVTYQEKQPEVVSDNTDILVKASENDTVASYLEQKITWNYGVSVNVLNEWDNEFLEISLDNVIPSPSTLDCGKVISVNKDWEYSLSNCCGNNELEVTWTDWATFWIDQCLNIVSEHIKVTLSEDDETDCVNMNMCLPEWLELFTIIDWDAVPWSTSVSFGDSIKIHSDDWSILVDVTADEILLQLLRLNSDINLFTYTWTESPTPVQLNAQWAVTYTSSDDTVNVAVTWWIASQVHNITLDPAYYGGKTWNWWVQTFEENVKEDVIFASIENTNNASVWAPTNWVQALQSGLHYVSWQIFANFSSHDQHSYVLNIKKNWVIIDTVEEEGTFKSKTIQFHVAEEMSANDIITLDFTMSANWNLDLVDTKHHLHISPLR